MSRGPGGLDRVLSLPRSVTIADCPIPSERRRGLRRNSRKEITRDTSAPDALRGRITRAVEEMNTTFETGLKSASASPGEFREFASRVQSLPERLGDALGRLGAAAQRTCETAAQLTVAKAPRTNSF